MVIAKFYIRETRINKYINKSNFVLLQKLNTCHGEEGWVSDVITANKGSHRLGRVAEGKEPRNQVSYFFAPPA